MIVCMCGRAHVCAYAFVVFVVFIVFVVSFIVPDILELTCY